MTFLKCIILWIHNFYLENVDFRQKSNHGGVNKDFAVNNGRKELQRLQNHTDSIFDLQIRSGFHAKNDCMNAIKKTQPFSSIGFLASNIMESKHHILDQKLDFNYSTSSNSCMENILSALGTFINHVDIKSGFFFQLLTWSDFQLKFAFGPDSLKSIKNWPFFDRFWLYFLPFFALD